MRATDLRLVIVERLEGPADECGKPKVWSLEPGISAKNTVEAVTAAVDRTWRRWSRTAPNGGSYDKTRLWLISRDGDLVRFRVDLQPGFNDSLIDYLSEG